MGLFSKGAGAKAVVHIEGMTCMHCAQRVEKGIASLPGVKAAKVDLGKKESAIDFDPALVTIEEITAKINQLGYKA